MLTDVESSFKNMKCELGLRPIYHQKEERVTAHLFITLLAYHLVHSLRKQLKGRGVVLSWGRIISIMARQQRVTVSMPTIESQHIHVRATTKTEPILQQLFRVLNIPVDSLGVRNTLV
ncbi:MAG: transposase [Lentisphaeria bacterium]|jgi:transposase